MNDGKIKKNKVFGLLSILLGITVSVVGFLGVTNVIEISILLPIAAGSLLLTAALIFFIFRS